MHVTLYFVMLQKKKSGRVGGGGIHYEGLSVLALVISELENIHAE